MKTFHLSTESGKNARVPIGRSPSTKQKSSLLTSEKEETYTETVHRGDNPAPEKGFTSEAIIAGDPEVNNELAGLILRDATRGYRKEGENELIGDFQKFVTYLLPDGTVKQKTPHVPKKANTDDVVPIKMGKRIPITEAFSRFVFHNHYEITHDDGVKFEFLESIAKDLWEKKEMAALGAGAKGTAPLVFLQGGTPYRAYLYGETEGDKYRLLVLITRLELKRPESRNNTQTEPEPEAKAEATAKAETETEAVAVTEITPAPEKATDENTEASPETEDKPTTKGTRKKSLKKS